MPHCIAKDIVSAGRPKVSDICKGTNNSSWWAKAYLILEKHSVISRSW